MVEEPAPLVIDEEHHAVLPIRAGEQGVDEPTRPRLSCLHIDGDHS